ncbi:MAG: IclR family transcriptional regulator domain-containing protein [Ilumatobacteraceae bacterium]
MNNVDALSSGEGEFVQSLARGLRVLTAFSADNPRLSLADAARLTGLTRATTRRCLHTLMQLGYAETNGKSFQLTPRVLDLGYAYLSSAKLGEIAEPFMETLSEQLDESVSLAVLDGTEIVYVARVPTKRIMSIGLALGSRLPAVVTSMGRILLSSLPDDKLRDFLRQAKLVRYTQRTITDRVRLERELLSVRQQRYALVDRELEEGLRSLAVPLANREGRIVAALNVGTQTERVSQNELLNSILPQLRRTADEINEILGRR